VTRSLAEAEQGIREIRAKINSEDDFKKLALEHSECGSAGQEGDLGLFGRGQMQKPFEDCAFALQVGQMSEPIQTDSGVHILWRVS